MWGQNQGNNNYGGYPQQNQSPYGQPQQRQNKSKIPMSPGVALLGLVGQNTIKNQQQTWQNGNANYNYPSFNPTQPQQMQPPSSPYGNNPYANNGGNNYQPQQQQQQQGGWGQNTNPYGRQNSQPVQPSGGDLTPPPLPYSVNNQFSNHQLKNYMLNKMILDQYIPSIFRKWDMDRSGTIEMHEFPGMICELFRCMNLPNPSQNDMWYLMWKFDQDQNGKIDYYEWANMVYTLGGLKKP